MEKLILVVTADTNDADYITAENEITEEQLVAIQPVLKCLKDRRELQKKTGSWEFRHNWETNDIDNGKTPESLYVETELLTSEQVELFNEFVPYDEYGIHTIVSIRLLKVVQDTELF